MIRRDALRGLFLSLGFQIPEEPPAASSYTVQLKLDADVTPRIHADCVINMGLRGPTSLNEAAEAAQAALRQCDSEVTSVAKNY